MKVFVHNSAGTFNNVAGNQYNSGLLVPTGEINVVHGTRYSSSRGYVNNVRGTQYNLTRNGTTTSYVFPKNEVVSSISRNTNDALAGLAGLEINESLSSSDDHSSFRFPLSWKWKKFRGKEHPPKNDKSSKKSKILSSLSSDANQPLDLDVDMLDACGEICDQVKDISGDLKEISSLVSQEMRDIQSRQSDVHHKRASDSSGSVDSALSSGAIWSLYESMVAASREMYDLAQTLGYVQWERDAKGYPLSGGNKGKM